MGDRGRERRNQLALFAIVMIPIALIAGYNLMFLILGSGD